MAGGGIAVFGGLLPAHYTQSPLHHKGCQVQRLNTTPASPVVSALSRPKNVSSNMPLTEDRFGALNHFSSRAAQSYPLRSSLLTVTHRPVTTRCTSRTGYRMTYGQRALLPSTRIHDAETGTKSNRLGENVSGQRASAGTPAGVEYGCHDAEP